MATVNIGYATWVIDNTAEGCTKIKDPQLWLDGLEELVTMVLAAQHGAEWIHFAPNHLGILVHG
jgi:hypothetical protein